MNHKYTLVIDIGNTHIVLGVYEESELIQTWRVKTDDQKTADEYYSLFKSLKESIPQQIAQFHNCILASVVPELTRIFSHMISKYWLGKLIVVNAESPLGLTFLVPEPSFIGADLLVNAFIAKEKYLTHCIICDFGTATTIQLVGKDGTFYGTVIAPGVMTSASTLFSKAALLSSIELEKPRKTIGTSTKDALLSGIVTGHALMVDGLIRKIRQEFSSLGEIKAIATGGISSLICQECKEIDLIDKTLTLEGLYRISCRLNSAE
ncbi:MAG TPA: type III pantothenate kinase [Candidatus Cloacimonadota bacterium]|nr:type III pantothenate kinase [Candidatus Cloacimonadota bacterium]HPT71278.1 type III pantothenate kinase [Candidatus Cloacimonadota bacterium]